MNMKRIEKKWQKKWERAKIFEADLNKKPKFFVTFPYPYLNGSAHIGAAFTALRCDVYARFKRMQGFNVLFPQAFHATGTPIFGAIERLKKKEKTQIETFKLFGAKDKDIKNFIKRGPEFTVRFWTKKWIEDLKSLGYSADWRRSFITAITPTYSRFIEWQYNTLRKKDYVVQGTHPVIWCPHCKSPTGDHDRLEGIGESPIEYVVFKFKLESGEIIPCATLRPETIFGVTNIWINPEVKYSWAQVDSEVWLLSEQAIKKLKDQLKKIRIIGKIKGEKLIGKFCENPVLKNKIIILPASFVDRGSATGIVMSVPSHAPYDWIGLHDLQKNPEEVEKYKVGSETLEEIKPVSIIKTEGFGEHSAIEVSKKMGIQNQEDKEKLEEATSLVYKKEFHLGVLKENCKQYSGLKVSECKEKLSQEFLDLGIVDQMWETSGKVVCRCDTLNHVKILENQWFLKYSDEKWKEKVRKCIEKIKFYPEEARIQFLNTVDWLKDRVCARKTGLGTPLPWDREWNVETLSDSTIYMAYYTIVKIISEKKIPAEKLTNEVFDYVFLGKGNIKQVSKKSGLDEKIIKEMKNEFNYFYPVDLRNSATELVPNHFTFYLFHHVAIWDQKYWPKRIGVNGMVRVKGTKMSKSLGNIIPLKNLVKTCGSDLVRINIVASNEGLDDADWRDESLVAYSSRINFLDKLTKDVKKAKRRSVKPIDTFLQSKIQENIKETTGCFEEMKFRSGVKSAFFDSIRDIKTYVDRVGGIKNCNGNILKNSLNILIRLIAPFIPHSCEEFWKRMRNKGFVSLAEWPKYNEKLVNRKILELERIFENSLEDLKEVVKLVGKKKNSYLYVLTDKELEYFKENLDFIKKQFGFEKVSIFKASDPKKHDPQNKAEKAKYGKPGIYLE
jgi:leucyl-tRNA synthetase